MKWLALPLLALTLAACSSAPKKPSPPASTGHGHGQPVPPPVASQPGPRPGCKIYAPAKEDPSTRGDYKAGGLYAPGVADTTPDYVPDVDCIAEPVVTHEPPSPVGNRSPYSVLGKKYEVMSRVDGYKEQGTASYYGKKFHGRLTSNREVYDMYAFTAAHKTMPLPSFARVTNLDNGQSVVVRVNDRGPFHEGRVIDLSYAAAVKLGITQRGTGRVEVRALKPGDEGAPKYVASAAPKPVVASTTAMDQLVGNLPKTATPVATTAAVVQASTAAVTTSPLVDPRDPGRYRIVPDLSKPVSADRFDAWLAARNLKVVGGKIVDADTLAPVPVAEAAPAPTSRAARKQAAAAAPPKVVAVAAPPASVPVQTVVAQSAAGNEVLLQVGSFSSRDNAERALARISAAGIASGSLSDVESNGRTLWRLRVAAPDPASATALAGRIAGLGFGQPQVVRK